MDLKKILIQLNKKQSLFSFLNQQIRAGNNIQYNCKLTDSVFESVQTCINALTKTIELEYSNMEKEREIFEDKITELNFDNSLLEKEIDANNDFIEDLKSELNIF